MIHNLLFKIANKPGCKKEVRQAIYNHFKKLRIMYHEATVAKLMED